MRTSRPVAPSRLVATTVSTYVPPVSGTSTLKLPSRPAVVGVIVVAVFSSVFDAATRMALPGAEVPVTVTVAPTSLRSAGAVTVSGVSRWRRRT